MSYLMSIIMGLIQGVTEFLPISSSGHLTLFQAFFGMEDVESNHMLFAVMLHFGTFISVCIMYRQDIWDMIREFFLGIAALFSPGKRSGAIPPARRMVLLVIVGTLPLFVVVLVKNAVESIGNYPAAVSCALILTGFILFFSDRLGGGARRHGTPP